MDTRRLTLVLGVLAAVGLLAAGAGASAGAAPFPATIALPDGFRPEGIAIARGRFFVGSIPTGAIYSGSLRTGQGSILVPGVPGVRSATGLAADGRGRLFVSGAATGHAYVYDARTGALLRDYTLAAAPTFVNDVVVTPQAVYFTDSLKQVLHRLALGPGGRLPAAATTVPLGGDIAYTAGFNANGIVATPSGHRLVLVQSNTGFLFGVDPATGVADRIELSGGATVVNGDGLLLDGTTLYVVRNQNNLIAVVRLAPGLGSGGVVGTITSAGFGVPTSIAEHGNRLYAVNARFGVASPDTASYSITQVRKH
jgi:outer membrane protein assembly factor BamB